MHLRGVLDTTYYQFVCWENSTAGEAQGLRGLGGVDYTPRVPSGSYGYRHLYDQRAQVPVKK